MSPKSKEQDSDVNTSRVLALLKDWKEIIVLIGSALAAALTTFGFKAQGTSQVIGYALAFVLLAVGGYIYHRARRRQEAENQQENLRTAFEARKHQRTAFRGLYPYQEGDVLPGWQRQREAQILFTQLTDADFSFGIVCGDSGCGKTSLLRCALQSRLKDAGATDGFRVLYISNPRELINEARQTNDGGDQLVKLRRHLSALKHAAIEHATGAPLILIIDQFEEFFIEYEVELRAQLGAFLNELIKADPPARILCALRRDYLADMRDLAPQLPDPLSIKTFFLIRNFTPEQAADVIKECAVLDGLALDGGLTEMLAADLEEGGYVRPPELQIVCTALISNPTVAEYRLQGGARGILSHYIRNAVAICSEPKLGSQILRALCNFPAHAKRKPKTASELLAVLDTAGLSKEQASKLTHDILIQFESARLVLLDTRGSEVTYSLVHDYLVDAVAAATNDASTKTEGANQFLQYYLSQWRDDPKLKIPFRRYRFIKKHADKAQLARAPVRQLLRASRNAQIITLARLILLIAAATAALFTILSTRHTWQPREIGRFNHEPGINGIGPVNGGEQLITESASQRRLWDAKTGKLLTEIGGHLMQDSSDDFLIVQSTANLPNFVLRVPTLKTYPLPSVASTDDGSDPDFKFGPASNVLMYREYTDKIAAPSNDSDLAPPKHKKMTIKVWSILEQRELGAVRGLNPIGFVYLNKGANRLVTLPTEDKLNVPILWDVQSGRRLAELRHGKDESVIDCAISDESNRVVTLQESLSGQLTVLLWDLQTGSLTLERAMIDDQKDRKATDVEFSSQGDFVILSKSSEPLLVLNCVDLLRTQQCPSHGLRWVYEDSKERSLYWAENADMMIWNVTTQPPKLIRGFNLKSVHDDDHYISVYRWINRVLTSGAGRIELYDLAGGEKISSLSLPGGRWRDYKLTLDRYVLSILMEDGSIRLYSLEDGHLLADLRDVGVRNMYQAYYDPACQRVNIWTEGRVLRYTEGREIGGQWFRPAVRCSD